jgi:hypothetical protein
VGLFAPKIGMAGVTGELQPGIHAGEVEAGSIGFRRRDRGLSYNAIERVLFAPLPAVGPDFKWYPIPDNSRFYIEGAFTGMSFFGYGNFLSSNAVMGFPITQHWDARAGYLWGSRLKINDSNDNISLRLVQKGPVFGVAYHWGRR